MKTFHLKILAAEGLFYEGECESLILPISDGQYGILADHQNTCAAIKPGTLEFTVPEEGKRYAVISNGTFIMEDNEVTILAVTVERPEDVEINKKRRAEEEEYEERMRQQSIKEYKSNRLRIEREMNRLKVDKKGTNQDLD